MMKMILAMDKNGCIGRGNELPWKIPMDLKWFKSVTMGHPIVMGRKTRESIGRDLPGRENIILTRQGDNRTDFERRMSIMAKSLREDLFIIGGAELYNEYAYYCDVIYICHVDTEVEGGDAFFKGDLKDYRRTNVRVVEPCAESGGYRLTFVEYKR